MKKMLQQYEEEKKARERAALAKIEADRAAVEAKIRKDLEDRLKKEEISEAERKARAAAEEEAKKKADKAKEDSDKAIAEAKKKTEDLEKAKKTLEEEVKKHKPSPDDGKAPIKFKDAVGRKFSFPWRICKTWKVSLLLGLQLASIY